MLLNDVKLGLQVLHYRVGAHVRVQLVLPGELLQHKGLVVLELSRRLGLVRLSHRVVNDVSAARRLHNVCLGASGRVVSLRRLLLATGAIWLDGERDTVIDHGRVFARLMI